tara:strand:- start:364 stop:573 length:210 start_codon:yes stop_codon:yes gene_type:complete
MQKKSLTKNDVAVLSEIDALNIKFNLHEYHCEQNRNEILKKIDRLETIIIASYGSLILFLAGIVYTVII